VGLERFRLEGEGNHILENLSYISGGQDQLEDRQPLCVSGRNSKQTSNRVNSIQGGWNANEERNNFKEILRRNGMGGKSQGNEER